MRVDIQVELHPFLRRDDIEAFCRLHHIVIEAYSPLAKAQRMTDATLVTVAEECGVTPAQVMIRWSLQRRYVTIPKSTNPARIANNADVFGFELSDHQMELLNSLDEHLVTGWDPTTSL